MKRKTFDAIRAARAERRAIAVVTALATGEQRLVSRQDSAKDTLASELAQGFRYDRSGIVEKEGAEYFVAIHNPPLVMILIGAVHVSQALIPMARSLGYEVCVIDPRGAFATSTRFPGVELHAEWPDEVLAERTLDHRTALIALTHDPKIDDPALEKAVRSECFYIGALGSGRTHAKRLERLKERGLEGPALDRIHGPVGLRIGAKGSPEIAVSILAEVTQVLREG